MKAEGEPCAHLEEGRFRLKDGQAPALRQPCPVQRGFETVKRGVFLMPTVPNQRHSPFKLGELAFDGSERQSHSFLSY